MVVMKKVLQFILIFSALLCASHSAAIADEPAKKEQTAPAAAPTPASPASPTSQGSQPPSAEPAPTTHEFPFHTTSTAQSQSYEGAFVKMIVTVIVLIVFVLLTFWVIRRLGHGRLRGFGSNRSIQVIERKPLSPKSMLYLVQVGHQKFLIAESQLEVRRVGMIEELSETAADETN